MCKEILGIMYADNGDDGAGQQHDDVSGDRRGGAGFRHNAQQNRLLSPEPHE